jgi:hypothetical protein
MKTGDASIGVPSPLFRWLWLLALTTPVLGGFFISGETKVKDTYQQVVDKIIAALEAGTLLPVKLKLPLITCSARPTG